MDGWMDRWIDIHLTNTLLLYERNPVLKCQCYMNLREGVSTCTAHVKHSGLKFI